MTKKTKKLKKVTPEKPSKVEKSEVWYPHLNLKLTDIPEAKGWEIGKSYMLIIGVKFISIREDEDGSDVGFKVLRVKSVNKEK